MRQRLTSLTLAALVSASSNVNVFGLIHPTYFGTLSSLPSTTLCEGSFRSLSNNRMNMSTNASSNTNVDVEYPGTAVERLNNVRARVATLTKEDLSGDWEDVRRKILWAGGLRDLPDAIPGKVSACL